MPKQSALKKRVARLERVSRPEVKHKAIASGAFDDVGSITGTLIRPQQLQAGTSRDSRVGDKVKTRNIRFQAIFKMPANPSNSTCALRILVLRSKGSGYGTSDMPDWYDSVDEDKFFVIKDVLTQVSAVQARTVDGTSYQTGSTLKNIKFNCPTGLRKLQFDGTSNSSPLNNEYLIYMLAENGSAEVAYNWQHYYMDN